MMMRGMPMMGGRMMANEGGIMMASAPDPMDTRNDMMQNLAIDNFGKPLKDLTEDEIIQIEEMMDEMDQYGSKQMSRPNKRMADLDIGAMIDNAKEELAESKFDKSYDELNPTEQELILEIIQRIGRDVFGKKQMPEPDRVMAQEGGMMDMGGMEKDYRNEGGFVAIGGQERADDVPARLSKNEFVFTADAVRNAGGGNIDKGAEIMENMMENLEAGGKVSEESQGLQGARAMFATQKRLGEVL
jgi:hypothetical protein